MEHYERVRIRMECVEIASRGREGWNPGDINQIADELFRYIMEEKPVEERTDACNQAYVGDTAKGEAQAADPNEQTRWCIHLIRSAQLGLEKIDQTVPARLAWHMLRNAASSLEQGL